MVPTLLEPPVCGGGSVVKAQREADEGLGGINQRRLPGGGLSIGP